MQSQLGHMGTIFQIASSYNNLKADIMSIKHDWKVNYFHTNLKTTFKYTIGQTIPDAVFSFPKSSDSAIEDIQVIIAGPGVNNTPQTKGFQVLLKAEAEKLRKQGDISKLTQCIASEDVKNSQIMCFQLGGLKQGHEVTVVLEHIMENKIIYSADRILISTEFPTAMSLLYNTRSLDPSNQLLKTFYDRLKNVSKIESLVVQLERVAPGSKVVISSPCNQASKEVFLKYASVQEDLFGTASTRGLKLTVNNPQYSDWSQFRIDIAAPMIPEDITNNHVSRVHFSQTQTPIPSNSPLPVTGLLRIRHFTPFPEQVRQEMLANVQNRDPNLPPELEKFRKYTASLASYDVFFLLDQSGSMTTNNRHSLAIQGVIFSLKSLIPKTSRFNIYTFNTSYKKHYPNLMETNDANVQAAINLLGTFNSNGNTNLYEPLKEVLDTPMEAGRKRIVIILSDGELSSKEPETRQLIQARFSANPNLMLCGLCVGQDAPVAFFDFLKQFTNGGKIENLFQDGESISDSYIRLLKCSFWTTYSLKNFKIVGAKAAYMHPALAEIDAPQAEVTTTSFLLTNITDKITVSYDVHYGSKLVETKKQDIATLSTQNSETESLMKIEAQKVVKILTEQEGRAMGQTGTAPAAANPFNQKALSGPGRMLPVVDRPNQLTFREDLERIGMRFGMLTPYTSLAVNILGVNSGHSVSQTFDPVNQYGSTTRSFLSSNRNQSVMQDFDKMKFSSTIQHEFEALLADEVLLPSFTQFGMLEYTPDKAQKFLQMGYITADRVQKIGTLQDKELKDYNFTKYVVLVLLKLRGDTDRWQILLSKCCKYLDECRQRKLHEKPDWNPFAGNLGSEGMQSYIRV